MNHKITNLIFIFTILTIVHHLYAGNNFNLSNNEEILVEKEEA